MNSRADGNSASLPSMITIVVSIAALYFGREVLIPLFLAAILSLVLAPLVTRLEHIHLGRIFPVLLIVFLTVAAIGALGWMVAGQGVRLAAKLPQYSASISRKIESIRGANSKNVGKVAGIVQQLGSELSNALQPSQSNAAQQNPNVAPGGAKGKEESPVPVKVVQQKSALQFIRSYLGPVVGPVATLVLMIVFMAFMLYRRKELRERMFSLAGLGRIHATREAFQDATHRVVRYLWLLALVNAGFGILFGTGLYFLGLPQALLWGILTGLLRFIPYIGSAIGAAMPIILAFALFDGWVKPLIALGIFLVLEGTIGYWLEPILYSSQTGISPLAILVAAVFWAALWGPAGLLMSTPLTVCVVVIGRHVPQLEFLNILFGGEKILAPEVQVYQALASMDIEAAHDVIDEYLKTKTVRELYENIFIPVLVLAEGEKGEAASNRRRHLYEEFKDIVEELVIHHSHAPRRGIGPEAGAEQQVLPSRPAGAGRVVVICMPVRDQGDEIAAMMLAHLFMQAGYDAHTTALDVQREMLEEAAEHNGRIFYISALPPFSISPVARLYRQIHAKFRGAKVAVGLWTYTGEKERMRSLLKLEEKDPLCTSLSEGLIRIQGLLEATPAERH